MQSSIQTISPLRQRMVEDMRMRKLMPRTRARRRTRWWSVKGWPALGGVPTGLLHVSARALAAVSSTFPGGT